MRQKMLLSMFLLCFCFFQTIAQRTITGTVTSKDGTLLSDASVIVSGQKTGVRTSSDGTFSISVPSSAKQLTISYVGSETQRVNITSSSNITVALESNATALQNVVIVGYGSVKKKDATGSVVAIGPKDFNKGVIATPNDLLQGRLSGVSVTPSSGEPGAASTISIRGTNSIRDQQPLYVVDGVPISPGGTTGTLSGVEGSSSPKDPLSFLNPNDIESITVLKDASSAAIYGSRGANGVIIVTTKSGKSQRGSLTFSANTSLSTTANRYDLLNGVDFLAAVKKANVDAGTSDSAASVAITTVDKGFNTDWQDQIFRTAISQGYNLGWGLSRKSTAVRVSGSYDDLQGIVKNSSLKRITGRANITQKFLDDKLRFDVNFTYSNIKNEYPPLTNNAGYQGSLLGAAITFNPTYPVFGDDGGYYDPKDGNRNPSEMLAYFNDKDDNNRLLTNVSGSYEIIKGLVYKGTFGYDDFKSERLSFADPRLSSNAFGGTNNVNGKDLANPISGNGRGVKQNLELKSILVEHTLTYDKSFSNGHVLNAVVGYSYQQTETNFKGRIGWGLTTPVVAPTDVFSKNFNSFKNYYDLIPGYSRYDLQSYFGRVNYTINDKYLLTGTMRIDGSSKFGTNNKYGYFPAFAAKWKLIKENFAVNSLGRVFSEFSLRGNYGKLGSQEGIGPYDAIDLRQVYQGSTVVDTATLHIGNKNLKWEESTTTGAGLDFATLDNRLSGSVDYYYTKRKDLLFYAPTPGGFSATSNWFVNLPGSVINQGVEMNFNYKIIRTKKFSWDISYNMTFIKNRVQDFNVVVNTGAVHGQGLSGAYAQTFANGYPLFTWKMPTFYGFNLKGDARYGDGKDHLQGSALPNFLAGLTNNFTLGNWSASVFVNTVRGFYVYNNTANALFLRGSIKTAHNVTYDAANSPEDPINPGSVSTRFLEKGDFIRISNASLSYSFNMKKGKAIKTLSLAASGQNLALFTKYSGLDPEVNLDENINGVPSRGFDYVGYPKARTFTLGINAGF